MIDQGADIAFQHDQQASRRVSPGKQDAARIEAPHCAGRGKLTQPLALNMRKHRHCRQLRNVEAMKVCGGHPLSIARYSRPLPCCLV